MSASPSDLLALAASTTSSGFADGLGRRALAFDREEGTMLERLTVRPELAAFETMLRDRVDRVSALEDERIARPRSVEHDGDGALVVVSEFVPGTRLADLLDVAADQGASPGVDAAFGYLLDVLPALCGLHAGAGFTHGAIAPSRTILTPAGQIVLLDAIYGGALAHLRYSRRKLWTDFGIVTSDTSNVPRLEVQADIAQVVLSGVMLVLGRPLYVDEYPDALSRLLLEVGEVAQIRGSAEFATGLQVFLHRALPLPNRQPYATADDALIDLRDLASELGVHVCRRALVDFIEQMEPSAAQPARKPDIDDMLASIQAFGLGDGEVQIVEDVSVEEAGFEPDLEDAVDAEIDLAPLAADDEQLYDGPATREVEFEAGSEHASLYEEPVVSFEERATPLPTATEDAIAPQPAGIAPLDTRIAAPAASSVHEEYEDGDNPAAGKDASPSVRSRRAKRTRSARARKDKLRSAAVPAPLITQKAEPVTPEPPRIEMKAAPEPPVPPVDERDSDPIDEAPAPPPPEEANWLVKPGRADAFEPPIDNDPISLTPSVAPTPPPFATVTPVFTPAPAARPMPAPAPQLLQYPAAFAPPPVALPLPAPPVAASNSPFGPQSWTPTPVVAAPPLAPPAPAPLKLKDPIAPPRASRPSPPVTDIWAAPPPGAAQRDTSSPFPWKLAAAALVAMAVLIVGGRALLRDSSTASEPETAPVAASSSAPAARNNTSVPAAAAAAPVPAASNTGRLEIETQPAGAKILIDGKPAGESPLTLDALPVGRHSVTLTTASGSVKRSVRIEAGRTLKLDVPIFSGWVGIFAPFVLEVAEGGRVIGTTEESRLMLSPGRHDLTLTNRDLGYTSVQTVEIEPGEVRSVTLDPRGTVNLNASPWAEVWVDGKKVGDTPLAGLQLPLGIQEITFRHPQFGERRVTVSVKGNAPAALSVDMTRR